MRMARAVSVMNHFTNIKHKKVIIIRNRNIYGNGLCTGANCMSNTRLKSKKPND